MKCGYWIDKEVIDEGQVIHAYEVCLKPVVAVVKDPLDGYNYPLCKRHWGVAAKKAAKVQGLEVTEVDEDAA